MSHLWIQDDSVAGEWLVFPLEAGAFTLPARGAQPGAQHQPTETPPGPAALLMRSRTAGCEAWLLMSVSPSGVRLNGAPLRTGIRVLRDRDELLVAGLGRAFFSTERLPFIEVFPGADRPTLCPRCKQPIALGLPAAHCPQCGVWHHQTEDLPCWTYAEHCAMCDQLTDLTGTYRWTPEDL